MNAAQLISYAYYLSGIRSRTLEDVTNTDTADGLELLNDILAEKSIDSSLINYFTHTEFNTVPGQEEYFIPDLVDLSSLTFNIDDVRYKMIRDFNRKYFGSSRVDNITSLPFHYYAERTVGGMNLYLYFIPDDNYLMKITGKFSLAQISDPSQNLDNLDRFYTSYLKYELAYRICNLFDKDFPQQSFVVLNGLRTKLENMVGIDLTIEKDSLFPARTVDPFIEANLGRGWTP